MDTSKEREPMNDTQQETNGVDGDYRLMLDSLFETALVKLDRDGNVRFWSKGAELMTGYRGEEILGRPVTVLYPDEDRKRGLAEQELSAAASQGRAEVQGWRVAKDGRRFWASVLVLPTRDASGVVSGCVQITRDVTEQRRQELELRKASLMVDSVTDYEVIMLDPNGIVRSWNRGAELMKGYKADEVIGKHVSVFYTAEDAQSGLAARELETAARTGRFELEGWRVKKGGAKFWANVVLSTIKDESGQLMGFVKVARDLTERNDRDRLLQRQRDEILELSTPVIQIWDKILALPIIGTLDSLRAARLTESLLQRISEEEAEFVILDISGVPTIDTQVAQHLLKTVHGARLMGAESIISGVRPETAQAMVHLGIEIGTLRSRATLRDALQLALRLRRDRTAQQAAATSS